MIGVVGRARVGHHRLVLPGIQLAVARLTIGFRRASVVSGGGGAERAAARRLDGMVSRRLAAIAALGGTAAPIAVAAKRLWNDLCEQCRTCRHQPDDVS
jgi:hypothetical protein